jgi:hypothetical protein
MSGQWIAVIVLVALAALYVLRAFSLSLRKGNCGTGQLRDRLRKMRGHARGEEPAGNDFA